MAAAAPSSLASSVEKTNGAKLSRLLIDGGTTVLRNVFDRYHPPANLAAGLNANYPTLNSLKTRRVLHKPQWDLLFPPGGATPDSKAFDITLLFLLLTNICRLSPPLSGWHKPPPSRDTSLEANLTRVKLYRNELYGHVTSTGVQTAVFNVKWQEISTVLVSLGLNPVEVVRLKSAPCGEDYISAVMEWAKSDGEITSQLGELRKRQHEARQILEEDHNTLQDTHYTLKGVWQIHKDTREVVEEVLRTQKETLERKRRKTSHVTQQTVLDIRKSNQDTHQVVKEVLKTQQEACQIQHEDHSTLQVTQQTVEDVRQINQDTHQVVKTLLEDRDTLQVLHQNQNKTQQTVEVVLKTQEQLSETLQAVKQAVHSLKEGRHAGAEQQVLQNLAKSEFKEDIEHLVGRYQEGTREWVFNEVENWLDNRNSKNRVLVISSKAGMGKSVISAVICKRMQEAGRLSGSHFCQHNNARYRNPQLMLQSLACHLSHAHSEYKQALVEQLSRNLGKDLNNMGVEELFALLFKEPLSNVAEPGRNMLMVIDGLDESDYQERNELLDVVANHFCKLPRWIRFLCTTRPERNIAEALKHLKPFLLESNDDKNMEDIKWFFEKRMPQQLIREEEKHAMVEKLVEKSEGLMMYAYFLVLFIEENKSEDIDDSLPLAISSVYHSYFKRLENELTKKLGVNEDDFHNLLCAVIASREPMPIDFVSKLLVPNARPPVARRRKALEAINSVSSLLPIRHDCLHVIHKSVKDWLSDASCYGEHHFTMDEKEGHRILADLCTDELDHLKQKGVRDAQFSATEKYALHHGVRHMLQLEKENVRRPENVQRLEKCVETYVIDLDLLYAKLCLNCSIAAGDISWLRSHDLFQDLSENSKYKLNTLILLLRREFSNLTDHPCVFFQTLLNEGGPDLSPMASNMLRTKFPEMPYMEFLNKQMQEGAFPSRFQFSSKVVCFDVSQQFKFMVCECDDGTIQLWSLLTGALLWTRPVKVTKCYHSASRVSPFLSGVLLCYRSVVFHPSEPVVLPGVLSHAYDFNGDLKPLFPESKSSFTVCSVSGDKTKMLTDCPDDVKCIIMWSLKNGSEITRSTRNEAVLSFAWSRDGKLLAISHCKGFISIVDVVDGFRTLGQTDLSPILCGKIRFSSDCRSLFCWYLFPNSLRGDACRFDIQITEHATSLCKSPELLECETHSDGGFLLGDPLPWFPQPYTDFSPYWCSHFALDERTVLRRHRYGYYLEMTKHKKEVPYTWVREIVFSLSGKAIYVLREGIISAWNVSTNKLIEQKIFNLCSHLDYTHHAKFVLPVKGGVLLLTGRDALELWNFELSRCVKNWTNIRRMAKMIAISEERVAIATEERKLIILDTTSGKIVSTVTFGRKGYLLACNSKGHLLTFKHKKRSSLQLSDGKTTLWKEQVSHVVGATFSPAETFVAIWTDRNNSGCRLLVLDAASGKTLHILCHGDNCTYDCKFVSDEECVVTCQSYTSSLQLFNVKSGDLLSIIDVQRFADFSHTIAAFPGNRLLAVQEKNSERGFQLIQVHMPRGKDSRKMKWIFNTGDHKTIQAGQQEVCSCLGTSNVMMMFPIYYYDDYFDDYDDCGNCDYPCLYPNDYCDGNPQYAWFRFL